MITFAKSDRAAVEHFLGERQTDVYSYPEIGATRTDLPPGYTVDHNRILLGSGREVFERSKTAIRKWKMFDFSWIKLIPNDTPVEGGNTVAILVRHLGFYSFNSARIVYTIDEHVKTERTGFAYGTLTEHAEIGEERFSVEFNSLTGEVYYDLLAFSRPRSLLEKFGYPASRYFQKRFARDSKFAMHRAVNSA